MVEVVVSSLDGLRQEIATAGATLAADEPREFGGAGSGPTPYELLLGALGACTSMTLLLYARRKGWPLEAVEVRLRHDRLHSRDCADCETKEGWLDAIEKEIVVAGDLAPEQVERLGEIAHKCPVNQTLLREVRITQTVRRAGSGNQPASGEAVRQASEPPPNPR
jgi:putative redox protein